MSFNDQEDLSTDLLAALKERAKELDCLYRVEEQLADPTRPLKKVIQGIIEAIPPGWQYPDLCQAHIRIGSKDFISPDLEESPWALCTQIVVEGQMLGGICVYYSELPAEADEENLFLPEEIRLVQTIAKRLGQYIHHQQIIGHFANANGEGNGNGGGVQHRAEWRVVLDLLRMTNPGLAERIARKMMNYLVWHGVDAAGSLLQRYGQDVRGAGYLGEVNQPRRKASVESLQQLADETFQLAARHLNADDITDRIRKWVDEDKSSNLVKAMVNTHAPLEEVAEGLRQYVRFKEDGGHLPQAAENGARVGLLRRFCTDHLDFITVAKKYVEISDFHALTECYVAMPGSRGRLGGKGTGLFLASAVLRKAREQVEAIGQFKTPRTWYVTSDGLLHFVNHNNLEEVREQKYREIEEVRQSYPHIIQLFKNSHFPRDMVTGFSLVLDELGDVPLIVRSSSLLEDQLGAAFSGKYKSLFLANQGSRRERLEALMDAIAEVYASTFGPDPLEYRAERGLLDFNEEMGILIQEVVGKKVGRWFFPAWAGVAFSFNEFRWSPRIRREDGLMRIVPGLGTRAVDRLADDYPMLISPTQPQLRVNVTLDETVRYSPRKIDVIDLERNSFVTLDIQDLLKEVGADYPQVANVVSVLRSMLQPVNVFTTDFERDPLVVSFDGLVNRSPFVRQIGAFLKTLKDALGTPVDIEFACNGEDLYLLQCRPQSRTHDAVAMEIPDVPRENIIFNAKRHVSNGRVPDITHIVYVAPERYSAMASHEELVSVGRAVGRLNKLLPKRQFILMGPGRWGSRGDIQLGVRVTYSDINNTAMLIEIARKKGSYVPDLSFGTHFFQDLVEASIRYLPLYPDDRDAIFAEGFLLDSPNVLADLAPEFAYLADAVRVIDVPRATGGRILRVLMNAERDLAQAHLAEPTEDIKAEPDLVQTTFHQPDDYWRWRMEMAERIAAMTEPARFGVVAMYVFGSTKNATAGPGSDIDLLVHVRATEQQEACLRLWLEGWSICLAEMNYLRTGYRQAGLLDVHLVTDQDIENRTSFAVKIGAVTDAARQLRVG